MTNTTRGVPRVLAVAGSDPSGGAGIQADLKSIAANGGYGMAAITALTAQNTRGVREVHVPPVAFLRAQLDAVSDDIGLDAVKIGMLGTAEVARTVGEWLGRVRPAAVVLDPVMAATSGDRLLDAEAQQALRDLLPLADLLTPNVPELAVIAGEEPAADGNALVAQAAEVSRRYGVAVLAKGGHIDGQRVDDMLVGATGGERHAEMFSHPRVDTTATHGTGCSLSSAIATLRGRGVDWSEATERATAWLAGAIARGHELDVGGGSGPVHHFAEMWRLAGLGGERE